VEVGLVGGHAEGRSPNIAPATCINWFPEGNSLVSTHGSKQFSLPRVGEVRGGIEFNDLAYFVVHDTLYEFTSGGTAISRGSINTITGPVSMAHNGVRADANQQIMIVDGSDGWIYDNTAQTLTRISDTDYTNSTSVVFLDGYFVFAQKDSDRFWITSLYDGTAVDANDFATAEGDPDTLQAVATYQRELFLFGKKTLEVWYNSGDSDNTFQRYQGGSNQTGTAAGDSVKKFDNGLIWLTENLRGDGYVAVLGDGYKPIYVSTPEVNYQISTYSRIDDAKGYVYSYEGHEFYVLTFPTAKVTWVYDALEKQWHQRGHAIDGTFPNRERYNCHVFAYGKHLFGDVANGKIYELDPTLGTIAGTRVPRERITPILTEEENRIRISAFQLDMEEGKGDSNVTTDDGMWLSYSKDGGHTYSNEVERSMGDLGSYAKRLIWRRLGHARNWIFRLRTWSPNPMVLKGAYARLYGDR